MDQAAAGVDGATIYALRDSSISRLLLLPIRLVAELHNTSTPIIEAHYGRFIARHGDDLVRAAQIDTSPAWSADNVSRQSRQSFANAGYALQRLLRGEVRTRRQ
jgi:hypothetical protein